MQSFAQSFNSDEITYGTFTHFDAGLSVGTEGIGIELGTDLAEQWGLRAGVNFMPGFSKSKRGTLHNNKKDYALVGEPNQAKMTSKGTLSRTTFNLIADYYPLDWLSISAGFSFGGNKILKLEANDEAWKEIPDGYLILEDYRVPVRNGKLDSYFKVNGFRPYIGVGFGDKTVPKNRIGYHIDLGLYFHGSPKLYDGTNDKEIESYTRQAGEADGDEDCNDYAKTVSGLKVYPQLKVTLRGRFL